MRVAEVLEETTIPTYSKALLLTESRKTCTNLANSINQSHDALYHDFRDPIAATNEIKDKLEQVAQSALDGKKTYLVFDDSQITKPYARDIEGIDVTFDGSTGRPQLGLQLITALLTDGLVRMPVNVIPFITEQIAGAFYQSKSKLATTLLSLLVKSFTISMVLADAHYATKEFLSFLFSIKMPFLMKITRAKKVRIGKRIGQLQELLRLRRNEHVRVVRGDYDGNQCSFYVAKLENGSTVYFISLYAIDRNELIKLYRILSILRTVLGMDSSVG